MKRVLPILLLALAASVSSACKSTPAPVGLADVIPVTPVVDVTGPKVLVVVAHPDDEIAFAGVMYKTATLLGGACDVMLITNGEGGFKYSTLAEPIYGVELSEEPVGRAHLPAIRTREFLEGCSYMGVRQVYLLAEQDHRYTQDPYEVLAPDAGVWDLGGIQSTIRAAIEREGYDFVLGLSPTTTTHAHHQAATILALRAVESLPAAQRPAVLCVSGGKADETPEPFAGRDEFPSTRPLPGAPSLSFDRLQPFGFKGRLHYGIIANWAIAAHKSQGTMQLGMNRTEVEHYTLFEIGPPDATERCEEWFDALRGEQYPAKTYGESAGTNTR